MGVRFRKFRDTFKSYTDEGNLLSVINIAREDMWPKGQLKENRESRSEEERSRTRHGANQKLAAFMPGLQLLYMVNRSSI
jgi:sorting nexin-25